MRRRTAIFAVASLLVAGLAVGWGLRHLSAQKMAAEQRLENHVRMAVNAHGLFEIGSTYAQTAAREFENFRRSVQESVGVEIRPPSNAYHKFVFAAGRIFPFHGRSAAHLVFVDEAGRSVSIIVVRGPDGQAEGLDRRRVDGTEVVLDRHGPFQVTALGELPVENINGLIAEIMS